jgi:hypothetical protein
MGVVIHPCDREEYETNVTALRKALGKTRFDRAWAEGRAMSWEEAVREALGVPEEP